MIALEGWMPLVALNTQKSKGHPPRRSFNHFDDDRKFMSPTLLAAATLLWELLGPWCIRRARVMMPWLYVRVIVALVYIHLDILVTSSWECLRVESHTRVFSIIRF